jgi:hypothetical protein
MMRLGQHAGVPFRPRVTHATTAAPAPKPANAKAAAVTSAPRERPIAIPRSVRLLVMTPAKTWSNAVKEMVSAAPEAATSTTIAIRSTLVGSPSGS